MHYWPIEGDESDLSPCGVQGAGEIRAFKEHRRVLLVVFGVAMVIVCSAVAIRSAFLKYVDRHDGPLPLFSEWTWTDMGWRAPANVIMDKRGNILLLDRARNTMCILRIKKAHLSFSVDNSPQGASISFPDGFERFIPTQRNALFLGDESTLSDCRIDGSFVERMWKNVEPSHGQADDVIALAIKNCGNESPDACRLLLEFKRTTTSVPG